MEVILSNQCESLTGILQKDLGYSIQRRGKRFYAVRNSRGFVPRDGLWRFICRCAVLAKCQLYISDIRVKRDEFILASWYAGRNCLGSSEMPEVLDAEKVLFIRQMQGGL